MEGWDKRQMEGGRETDRHGDQKRERRTDILRQTEKYIEEREIVTASERERERERGGEREGERENTNVLMYRPSARVIVGGGGWGQ